MPRKTRTDVPPQTAAQVLFASDRTCCVCRKQKPVQIHHIDDDPANHAPNNLAVLCFDCHRETQIRGGFDRKLDSDQIVLYRNDWLAVVARRRGRDAAVEEAERARDKQDLALAMSVAEIYREAEAYDKLAIHFDILGNGELRDKYIELSIKQDPSDDNIAFLRGLQNRPDLIPKKAIARELAELTRQEAWHNRARLLHTVGRKNEAVSDYVRGISESLLNRRYFSAAYYLKEVAESGLIDDLFVKALEIAQREKDLWWQMRALEELELYDELAQLMLDHADEIDAMDSRTDPFSTSEFKRQLALARGDLEAAGEYEKRSAKAMVVKPRRNKRL